LSTVPPQLIGAETVAKIKAIKGTLVTLECDVSGTPQPRITWIKDGSVIEISNHPHMSILNDGKTLQVSLGS